MKFLAPLTLTCSMLLVACAEEPARIRDSSKAKPQPTPRGADANPTPSLTEEIRAAEKMKEELALQKLEGTEHLNSLRLINDRLCQRLFKYRKECPVAARLMSVENDKVLGCVGNYEEGERMVPKFTVTFETSSPASVYFRADNAYESGVFGNSSGGEIHWNPMNAGDTRPPRIWDLTQLKLRAADGSTLPSLSSITQFELRVNNDVVLTKDDLVATPDSSGLYDIKLDRVFGMKISSANSDSPCLVGDDEIDDIIKMAKEDAIKSSGLNLEDTQAAQKKNQEEAAKLAALRSEIDSIKTELGKSQMNIDRESDRSGKLTRELEGDRNVGCFAKQAIETLEIEINGAHLPLREPPFIDANIKRTDVGNPRQFIFKFGEQFAHTHADEEQQSLFVNGGRFVTSKFAGKRIGDLEYISIEKGGVGWDAVAKCTECGLFKNSRWFNSEKNRYRLDSLIIKANGEEVYRTDALNFTFQEETLNFSDKQVSLNQAYRKLMRRSDCPVKK